MHLSDKEAAALRALFLTLPAAETASRLEADFGLSSGSLFARRLVRLSRKVEQVPAAGAVDRLLAFRLSRKEAS